jgi:hypothetical protein
MKFLVVGVVAFALKRKAYSFSNEPSTSGSSCQREQNVFPFTGAPRRNGCVPPRDETGIRAADSGNDSGGPSENSNVLATAAAAIATPTTAPIPSPSLASSYYYLLWSPGFVKQFGIASAGLLGVYASGWDRRVWTVLSRRWAAALCCVLPPTGALPALPRVVSFPNFILPLLSSSCCLIQIAINVLVGAGGCAGFNTLLGPVRPSLLAFMAYVNVATGAGLRQWILRCSIAMMPEGLFLWNEHASRQWRKSVSRSTLVTPSPGAGGAPALLLRATIVVDIPTMGCVACINKIEASLRQCDPTRIVDATSWLEADRKGGRARVDVRAESEADLNIMTRRVVDVIEGAGFHGTTVADLEILSSGPTSPS